MQAGAAPVVTDVGVASCLEEPLGKRQISVDAGLQQRHVGLRRIVDEDIGHVRVGIRKFQRTCIQEQIGNNIWQIRRKMCRHKSQLLTIVLMLHLLSSSQHVMVNQCQSTPSTSRNKYCLLLKKIKILILKSAWQLTQLWILLFSCEYRKMFICVYFSRQLLKLLLYTRFSSCVRIYSKYKRKHPNPVGTITFM